MFGEGALFTDFTIICADDKRIPVTKNYLCNFSYFKMLFTNGMKESQENIIEMKVDETYDVFLQFLTAAHEHNLNTSKQIIEFLDLSNKYLLDVKYTKYERVALPKLLSKQKTTDNLLLLYKYNIGVDEYLKDMSIDLLDDKYLDVNLFMYKKLIEYTIYNYNRSRQKATRVNELVFNTTLIYTYMHKYASTNDKTRINQLDALIRILLELDEWVGSRFEEIICKLVTTFMIKIDLDKCHPALIDKKYTALIGAIYIVNKKH